MQKSLNLKEMRVLKNILYFEAQSMKWYIESLIERVSALQISHIQITPPPSKLNRLYISILQWVQLRKYFCSWALCVYTPNV